MKTWKNAVLMTATLLALILMIAFTGCNKDGAPAETVGGESYAQAAEETTLQAEATEVPDSDVVTEVDGSDVVTEAPETSAPDVDDPTTGDTDIEESVTDEIDTDEPTAGESDTDEPATDEPTTEEPDTEPPHEHSFGEWSADKAATCTEKGSEKRTCVCGESESREVAAKGHTEVTDAGKDATCTETGLTAGKHCASCSEVLVAQTISAALGHEYVDRVCIRCGERSASEGLAFFSNGNGTCSLSDIGSCTDTDIVIPAVSPNGDMVIEISTNAFYRNTKITSVVIPEGVTTIKDSAFSYCTALTNVSIPNSVISIGKTRAGEYGSAFSGCDNLNGNTYDNAIYLGNENNPYLWCYKAIDKSIENVQLHENTCGIMSVAFHSCKSLDNVIIPDQVIFIGCEAFGSCSNMKNVTMSRNVMTIGSHAFASSGITTMELPDTVSEIGSAAFASCKNLKTINIPQNVTTIYRRTFANCAIERITIHDKITNIKEYAFSECSNLEEVIFLERKTPLYFDSNVFEYCTSLESIDLLEGMSVGYNSLFYGCTSLKSIVLPRSATKVGYYAFAGCTSLESVVLPNTVWAIAESAFANCGKLANINIPDSVSSIGSYAFKNCTSLTSVVLSYNSNYKSLNSVFTGCTNLTSVTIYNNTTKFEGTPFLDCTNLTHIYYNGSKYQWKSITKGSKWNQNTGSYTVHCTDGDLSKSES